METYELEEEVRTALIGNAELMAALPNGANAVYPYVAPATDPSRYPIIVYSSISDVPTMNGDDREQAHSVTIRVHVITTQRRFKSEEQNFKAAYRLVKEIMTELGFARRQTIPFVEDGKVMRIFDFIKGVET